MFSGNDFVTFVFLHVNKAGGFQISHNYRTLFIKSRFYVENIYLYIRLMRINGEFEFISCVDIDIGLYWTHLTYLNAKSQRYI